MINSLPTILPLLADLLALLLFLPLTAPLAQQFQKLSFFNSLLVGAFFVVFCFAVYGIKKLQLAPGGHRPPWILAFTEKRRLQAFLGILFALFLALAIGYVTGFLDSVAGLNRTVLDEPSVTLYLLITPASWFGIALIYMLVLSSPMKSTVIPASSRFAAVTLFSALGVSAMAACTVAIFQAVAIRFAYPGTVLAGILLYLLFLLLFLPPRLHYAAAAGRPATVLTFMLLLVFFVASIGA